jgi:hypothetical protein
MPDTGAPYFLPWPDSTDLVRDAPQAFEDLATATATAIGGTGYKLVGTRYYTSSGTFATDDPFGAGDIGATAFKIKMVGGGGGGGGAQDTTGQFAAAGGGGSGVYVEKFYLTGDLTSPVTVTVGAGGAAAAAGLNAGGNGGTSSFGALEAGGGGGGPGGGRSTNTGTALGGLGGSASAGSPDFVGVGMAGMPGFVGDKLTGCMSGTGAASMLGGGARGLITGTSTSGNTATGYGGGGSGGASGTSGTAAAAGGAGGPGVIIVEVYV